MDPIQFSRFAREFLALYSTGRHARKTRLKMAQVIAELASLPGIESTADLTTAAMAKYVASKGPDANPNTVNGMLDYARAACNYAVEEGHLARCPNFRRVRPRARRTTLNRACTFDQVAALMAHLRDQAVTWEGRRLHALVALMVSTGLRRDEALYAETQDLCIPARALFVVQRDRRLKTFGSERVVPLPDALVPILAAWLPKAGGPWLFPGVKRLGPWRGGIPGRTPLDHLKRAAAAVGIERITWHGLRHTFGTLATTHFDVPLWALQKILGHSDPRTTHRYVDTSEHAAILGHARSIDYTLTS